MKKQFYSMTLNSAPCQEKSINIYWYLRNNCTVHLWYLADWKNYDYYTFRFVYI